MKKNIEAVILDWAGTAIDFGSFAPVAAFQRAFEKLDIYPSIEEIREPMGLEKKLHITKMLQNENLKNQFKDVFNREPEQQDINEIYNYFEPALFNTLEQYTNPIKNVIETVGQLKDKKIKIGSTTGYNSEMMKIVIPSAKKKNYFVDSVVCPDEVCNMGRPYPYMIWKNAQILKVCNIRNVIKIGDTEVDMQEGKNAGCISVGVIKGSSILGVSKDEYENLSIEILKEKEEQARQKFLISGADFVINDITQLIPLIEKIEKENI